MATGLSQQSSFGSTVTSTASVACPSNFPNAVGGGFQNLGNEGVFPIYDDPTQSATGAANGWQASLQVNSGTVQAQVWVICST
jgi:hypothetical protein